ncbi:geraniol 8-hydroxylase-like [Magnolia sinica]|uniref:geraniol 8-hydroxylase-like n=1 Tax=Magnolia sinica TaxID=86752 RepID=UPI0026582C99|nr:geraniol 8-hydroxylase-like [Magnolia sinica]
MDFCTLPLWIFSIWACIHLLLLLARKKSGTAKLPPGPFPLPIVGNLFQLGNKPNESLSRLARSYGPLMTLRLGSITTVVVSSATMAKEVLQKHDHTFAGRSVVDAARVLHHNESSMVWLPAEQQWRKLRTICNTHIFATQRLDADQGLRRHKVNEIMAHVAEQCIKGEAVDIGQAALVTNLNLISNIVFSVDLVDPNSSSAQELKKLVSEAMEEAGRPNVADYFPWLRAMDPQGIRRRSTVHLERLHAIFDGLIEQRLLVSRSSSNSQRRADFLDVLLDPSHDNSFQLSRRDIHALLVDIFIASSDSTSSIVEWAMAELLRNPNTMARARSELIQTIGRGRRAEESDISRLPYLQAVVKETLRLHPTAPLLIPRKAESDVEICGFTIPRNTQVLVNAWAISRDPHVWVDPTSFSPERFLDSHVDFKGRNFELIPFGTGRRICPGMPLADRMIHLTLASLLHSFDWRLPDGMAPHDLDMSDKFGLTLQKVVPLRAIPVQG